MDKIQYTCDCSREGEYEMSYHLHRFIEEVGEFIDEPSMDEWGDVMMQVSLMIHCIIPSFVWLLPGAEMSQNKGLQRYKSYGCCRSKRHSCTG